MEKDGKGGEKKGGKEKEKREREESDIYVCIYMDREWER